MRPPINQCNLVYQVPLTLNSDRVSMCLGLHLRGNGGATSRAGWEFNCTLHTISTKLNIYCSATS